MAKQKKTSMDDRIVLAPKSHSSRIFGLFLMLFGGISTLGKRDRYCNDVDFLQHSIQLFLHIVVTISKILW